MSDLSWVFWVVLAVSLIVNGWIGHKQFSYWQWKRKKAQGGPRASQQYGGRGGKGGSSKGWQGGDTTPL